MLFRPAFTPGTEDAMNYLTPTRRRSSTRRRSRSWAPALATGLLALALSLGACSDDTVSPLEPLAAPPSSSHAVSTGGAAARVAGSLIRAPHSWPIVNWSTIRGLNAILDREENPDGSFELDIEIDFGDGPFLQETTEEVICLEIAARGDGATDIWISHAGLGWVTVPPGETHFSILHIRDAPGGDMLTARTIQPDEGEPSEFCHTRPDLSSTDPTGLGALVLMAAESGNVVSIDRR